MHHCYFNGKITISAETQVGITDLGLLRGYGLFDYFRTYNSRPFQWDWYWERFERSAKLLKIPNPITKEEAYNVVNQLIKLSGKADCGIRFVLTGGYTDDSISMTKPNLLINSEDIHGVSETEYEQGIKVISYDFVRDLPEIKSTDYKHLMILRPTIKEAGASDVLFHKRGYISELSRSNVFIFKGNKLITPKTNILKGITRRTVIEIAKKHFEVQERSIKLTELLEADEIFTTSSTKRILTISKLNDSILGEGMVGKNTRFLQEEFNELIKKW